MPINAARRQAKKEESAKKESAQKKRRAASSKGKTKHNEKSDYQQKIREKKLAEGARAKAKDGCAPKLFILLLPFTAVGAYLFLRS